MRAFFIPYRNRPFSTPATPGCCSNADLFYGDPIIPEKTIHLFAFISHFPGPFHLATLQ
jgi:hypothetical protein